LFWCERVVAFVLFPRFPGALLGSFYFVSSFFFRRKLLGKFQRLLFFYFFRVIFFLSFRMILPTVFTVFRYFFWRTVVRLIFFALLSLPFSPPLPPILSSGTFLNLMGTLSVSFPSRPVPFPTGFNAPFCVFLTHLFPLLISCIPSFSFTGLGLWPLSNVPPKSV